ncbi:hypothetical protein [Methanococcus voltae]|uniref:Uncharacterized protein n=1 Tax=Methanococcus voltae (strain ATCC BAA-1334 / A3) TaxID=456320 RepID=D7DTF0_METV3|nr:hypothetical protein [Methanococcus voltae]MCS3901262.1 hypothetical protein [Methanococcus voltae]
MDLITEIFWVIITYILYVIFETIFTMLGTKLVKINVELKQIVVISAIKSITYIIFGFVPIFGNLLGIMAAAYLNKDMFDVNWKNGFTIELPTVVFILIAMLLSIIFGIVVL